MRGTLLPAERPDGEGAAVDDLDKMARELLAAEYDRTANTGAAQMLRSTMPICVSVDKRAVNAIRTALLTAPPGWKLVPVELPVEMEVAFCEQWFAKRRAIDDPEMQDCWDAALDAAPEVK